MPNEKRHLLHFVTKCYTLEKHSSLFSAILYPQKFSKYEKPKNEKTMEESYTVASFIVKQWFI